MRETRDHGDHENPAACEDYLKMLKEQVLAAYRND